jgi:hypothetical protein
MSSRSLLLPWRFQIHSCSNYLDELLSVSVAIVLGKYMKKNRFRESIRGVFTGPRKITEFVDATKEYKDEKNQKGRGKARQRTLIVLSGACLLVAMPQLQ